ncbi:MAG TPA: VWA domain-containing protein [Polyangiaceae bacterium]|nr:VWA domain-containing protein [Polyangiaceae bacterium]
MKIPRWSVLGALVAVAALGCEDRSMPSGEEAKAAASGQAAATGEPKRDEGGNNGEAQATTSPESPADGRVELAPAPSAQALAPFGIGRGGGGMGSAPGLGNGAGPNQRFGVAPSAGGKKPKMGLIAVDSNAPPPAKQDANGIATPPKEEEPAPPPASTDVAIDPNGRFATTYRPGGGHLAAFESAVTAGLLPNAEREIVSDVGARYVAAMDPPKDTALGFRSDFERAKVAPGGGPIHVRLSLRSTDADAKERPHLSVVLVLDVSGSMRGELIQSARQAATALVDKLDDNDDFSLILFSTEAKVVVPIGHIGPKRDSVKKTIAEVHEGGGTNIGEGLRLGYEQAMDKKVPSDAVRVVMLLSDGRANDGITDRRQLSKKALDAFQDGIQTSSFGLGTDYDGPLMSQIANDGAGGYYYLKEGSQIAAALGTELDKRLDPVATAVEVRVRLKPGVELLNVYGSRRLTEGESQRVRTIEVAEDKHEEKLHGIKANRQNDVEGGMRFFIPAFARNDEHSILLKLRVPEGVGTKDAALVELKYKDRIAKKNVADEIPIKLEYADSDAASARSIDPSVARTVQGFLAGETLMKASQLVAQGQSAQAVDLLGEREGILHYAAAQLGEPLFVEDAKRLARLRVHAAGKSSVKDPLVLAMMMETAGNVHLH